MRVGPLAALSALVLLAGAASPAGAAEGELRVAFRRLDALPALGGEEAGRAFALLGEVTVSVEGVWSVRAEQAVLWIDPRAETRLFDLLGKEGIFPLWALRAIYAEGERVPAVFQSGGRIFRCASFHYDLVAHEGLFLDAELRLKIGPAAEAPDPFVIRAKRFRSLSPGDLLGEEVELSNTSYPLPRVTLRAERVRIEDSRARDALGRLTRVVAEGAETMEGPTREQVLEAVSGWDPQNFEGRLLRFEGVTARADGIPFFGWPSFETSGAMPVRVELEVGSRGRLGDGAHVGVGQQVGGGKLSWLLGAGYYLDRGPLLDPEISLRLGRLSGDSRFAYMHDDGSDLGVPPSTKNRFWTKHQYRWDFAEGWRVDGEFADLSDSGFLRAYDEGEFKEGKEQETLLHLRRVRPWGYASIVGKARSIGFLEQVEEMPRFRLDVPVATMWQSGDFAIQAAGRAEVANLRQRQEDFSADPEFRSFRVDVDPELFGSFSAGPARVVPFLRPRITYYDLSGDVRVAPSAGVRGDAQASRWYGDVLHLVNLSLEFEDLFLVDGETGLPAPIDDTDRVSRFEALSLRVRNRLRRRGEETAFLDCDVVAAWFPGGERPFGLSGETLLQMDCKWRPRPSIVTRTRFELEEDSLATASLEGWWRARPSLAVGGGFRHLDTDSDILTLGAECDVDTRWRLVAGSQFDAKNSDWLDQTLLVQRLGQTAALGIRFSYDPGDGDFGLGIRLDLVHALRARRVREGGPEGRFLREELGWR